jgi:tetratricopeptide (TPR) repeat protein
MPGNPHSSRIFFKNRNTGCGIACSLFIVLIFLFPFHSLAQRAKTDSLKKVLPTLQAEPRVDCLNFLSLVYSYLDIDTAEAYQHKAFEEANRIQYQRGEVMSLNNQALIAGHQRNFSLQEKICLRSIQQYPNLHDKKVIAETYMNLALALFCQGLFDRSTKACEKVVELSENSGDKKGLAEARTVMGSISFESGDYESAFEHFNQSLKIFKNIKDSYNTAIVLAKIGDLYRLAGDHKTALNLYQQSLEFKKGTSLQWHPLVDLGDAFYSLDPDDSTLNDYDTYLYTIKSLTIRTNPVASSRIRKAEKHIANKEYDNALAILKEDLERAKSTHDTNYAMRLLLNIARVYEAKKDFGNAFYFTRELLQTARQHGAKQYIRDGFRLMYLLHDQKHRIDSVYYYFQKYTAMKDTVALDDFSKRLAIHSTMAENEKALVKLELLGKEKQISEQQLQLSEQELQRESFLKNILVVGIFLLVLLGLILFRNSRLKQKNEAHQRELMEKELIVQKLESERTKGDLQQRALELEMQALRAQMNPHFIFNSLNSINRFILQNNKAQASEYLTKFSRLFRLILQNSQVPLIPLESELESFQLYLELEAVRFDHHFEYKIIIEKNWDYAGLKVPPLIIQPYAENAIWHGLMHKEDKGHLQIELFQQENLLCCKITDDGIGRKRAAELKSKSASSHKSMGMRITADRIAKLQKNQLETSISIVDLVHADGSSAGTEVLLKIPILYD